MKIVGATEYAVVLYRDKLPKFNNIGEDGKNHMIFNWFEWKRDNKNQYAKIHPTQKPVNVLKRLIEIFTDEGDVVIERIGGQGAGFVTGGESVRRKHHDGHENRQDHGGESGGAGSEALSGVLCLFHYRFLTLKSDWFVFVSYKYNCTKRSIRKSGSKGRKRIQKGEKPSMKASRFGFPAVFPKKRTEARCCADMNSAS